jgi:hypothetical protein
VAGRLAGYSTCPAARRASSWAASPRSLNRSLDKTEPLQTWLGLPPEQPSGEGAGACAGSGRLTKQGPAEESVAGVRA